MQNKQYDKFHISYTSLYCLCKTMDQSQKNRDFTKIALSTICAYFSFWGDVTYQQQIDAVEKQGSQEPGHKLLVISIPTSKMPRQKKLIRKNLRRSINIDIHPKKHNADENPNNIILSLLSDI